MAAGEFARVKELLHRALNRPEVSPSYIDPASDHDIYTMLADLAAEERDREGLERYAPLAEREAEKCSHQLYLAIAWRARGMAALLDGEHGQSQVLFDRALESFKVLDARWQAGRTHVCLAEAAHARADRAAERAELTHALDAFESLGAEPDRQRTHVALLSIDS